MDYIPATKVKTIYLTNSKLLGKNYLRFHLREGKWSLAGWGLWTKLTFIPKMIRFFNL